MENKDRGIDLSSTEFKEKVPEYNIAIIVHRHGPKDGIAGPLSAEGKEITEDYFTDAYRGFNFENKEVEGIDVIHSPIGRTKETAEIYTNTVTKNNNAKIKSVTEEERLSEGTVAEHMDLIEGYGGRGKWMKNWLEAKERPLPDVKTGSEAVQGFAEWLLEKITLRQAEGGNQEIDAFSHGPLMLVFLMTLEEKLNVQILPENWEDKKVFDNIIHSLSYLNFFGDSSNPEIITMHYKSQNYQIPLTEIEALAENGK